MNFTFTQKRVGTLVRPIWTGCFWFPSFEPWARWSPTFSWWPSFPSLELIFPLETVPISPRIFSLPNPWLPWTVYSFAQSVLWHYSLALPFARFFDFPWVIFQLYRIILALVSSTLHHFPKWTFQLTMSLPLGRT